MESLEAAFSRLSRLCSASEGLLPAEEIHAACRAVGYQDRGVTYTATTIVRAFVFQALSNDRSCRHVVAGVAGLLAATGRPLCSTDTGGYCRARQRLPEAVLAELFRRTGRAWESSLRDDARLWRGRSVRIVDGSTVQIADTHENRTEYPLQRGLTVGCHYPVVRLLAVFSWHSGAVLDARLKPYQGKGTGETGMLRECLASFAPGDVMLGDRYFAGYWDLAWWRAAGIDVVTRLPRSRRADFRRGASLGPDDHLIEWRATPRPDWLSTDEATALPSALTLREVRVRLKIRGARTRTLVIVTTLTDPERYPAAALAELYRRRWEAELNLRSLKTQLGMEHLRTKKPATVRKEFLTFLIAYNAVRRVAYEAARRRPTTAAAGCKVG